MTVRLSHGVQCARVIGPVRTMTREAAAAATRCGSTAFEDASDVVRLKTNDPTQVRAPSARSPERFFFFRSRARHNQPDVSYLTWEASGQIASLEMIG